MIAPGSVVLVRFPLTSGTSMKTRPAVVVASEDDASDALVTVAAITSSQRRLGEERGGAVSVDDLSLAGLARPSIVQTHRLFTSQESKIGKLLGTLTAHKMQEVRDSISGYLGLLNE